MSKYYGNILEDATIELTFNTFNADGASVTVTDFASTDVHVHKDGGLTQTNAGVTIDIDFDGVTGNHVIYIDTSADAFYAVGSNYEVRVEGITVATQTINAFIGSFSIENRFMRGTDGANTVVPDAAGVAPTAVENRQEMDANSTKLIAIVADTDELQGNQGDWATATGFATPTNITAGTITTVTGNVEGSVLIDVKGSIVGDVAGDVVGSVQSVRDDVTLGTDEIDADVLAASAVTEIQNGLATETKQDAGDVVTDRISAIQEADKVFVPAAGTLTYNTKGTSTAILKKNLKDPAGAAVDSTEDIIASEVDTTP